MHTKQKANLEKKWELMLKSLIQVRSVKLDVALQYSAWSKTSVLEASRAIKPHGVSPQRPAVETCPSILFVHLMNQKHLVFLPSFLILERSGSTILFSLGGSVLVDL